MKILRRPSDWWLAHPAADWLVLLLASGGLVIARQHQAHVNLLNQVGRSNRKSLYLAYAALGGTLLGFFLTSITIFMALLDSARPRLQKALAGGRAAQLQPVFFSAIRASGVAILVGGALFVIDSRTVPTLAEALLLEESGILLALRTSRLIYFVRALIHVAAADV